MGEIYQSSIFRFSVLVILIFLFSYGTSIGAVSDSISVKSVSEIKSDKDGDGELDYLGKKVTVAGRANVASSVFHEENLMVFIQDDSAGVLVYSDSLNNTANISKGDSLIVTGELQLYYGKPEIVVEDYQIIETEPRLPSFLSLDLIYKNPEKYLGMLAEGEAVVVGKTQEGGFKRVTISPFEGADRSLVVFVSRSHTRFDDFDFDVLSPGDRVAVEGVVDKYVFQESGNTIYEILPRTPGDISYVGIPRHYLMLILGGGTFLVVLTIAWVFMLRRQVKSKTQELQKSLEQKEMLLREIHHRVKNSLSIISGLIELQMDSTDDSKTQDVLKNSQSRIESVGLIHEKIYQNDSLSDVMLDSYLKELVEAIHGTFTDYNETVDMEFDIETMDLEVDKMIPCGLLVNELVVNAYKHAFKKGEQGQLTIKLQRQNGKAELVVADNGPGLPDDFELGVGGSLGSMLIETFAAQLEAETEIVESDDGTEFAFRFSPN